MSVLRHFSDTYYRPSWQGGDAQRPLCHRGQLNVSPATTCLTADQDLVTCNRCRKRLGLPPLLGPLPTKPAPLPAFAPVARKAGVTRTQIALEVAQAHGVRLSELRSPSRKRVHARPRQEAMALMIQAGFTTTATGAYFGRDHTTAIHARKTVAARLAAEVRP